MTTAFHEDGPGLCPNADHPCWALVVDDNPTNLLLAVEALRHFGFKVTAVGSGDRALEADRRHHFDAIFLDVHMPDLSGIEVTSRIRAFEEVIGRSRVPIIALTASASVADRELCLATGMDDVLTKPFDIDALHQCLTKWCRRHRQAMGLLPSA